MAAPIVRRACSHYPQNPFGFSFVNRIVPSRLGIMRHLISYSTSQGSGNCDGRDMSKRTYWEDFYLRKKSTGSKSFEWFLSHDVAKQWLLRHIYQGQTKEHFSHGINILELGCGTSALASNLLKDSADILGMVSTDFSSEAIEQARSLSRQFLPGEESVHFVVANAARLPFRNGQFDVVFEKGLCDAMLIAGHGSLARASFCETVRVLTPRGIFLQFSDENPDLRLSFFEEALRQSNLARNSVSVTFQEIGFSFGTEYFLYIIELHRL